LFSKKNSKYPIRFAMSVSSLLTAPLIPDRFLSNWV